MKSPNQRPAVLPVPRSHSKRKHERMLRGYLPYMVCLGILGIRRLEFYGLIRAGKVPPPEYAPQCYFYTIEQLACLIQAKFYATVSKGHYLIFSRMKFAEYLKLHWPAGGEDAKVKSGQKKRHWTRRGFNSQQNRVQSD